MERRRNAVERGDAQEFASRNATNWLHDSWDQSNTNPQTVKNASHSYKHDNIFAQTARDPVNPTQLNVSRAMPLELLVGMSADKTPSSDPAKTHAKLIILRQPEEQHRARYLSEGSRGAIKDRSGTSNCTIQLTGHYRPTRIELFAAHGAGPLEPHPLYKLIPVSGKTATTTPCKKVTAHDGIECLEVWLRPEANMTAVLDCMGILKICSYDAKQQRRRSSGIAKRQKSANSQTIIAEEPVDTQASTCTRICFRAHILNESKGDSTILKAYTEPIRCVQQLGVPEVLKISLSSAPARGGMDLFIIGRNFDRNTTVLFREYTDEGTVGWSAEATIYKAYFHQCHIVCMVPKYPNQYRGGTVSITVRCGQKSSHPVNFAYAPCADDRDDDDWAPPSSPRLDIPQSSRRGWCPPANNALQSSYYSGFSDDPSPTTTTNTTTSSNNNTAGTASKFMSTFFDYEPAGFPDFGFDTAYSTTDSLADQHQSQPPLNDATIGGHPNKKSRMEF